MCNISEMESGIGRYLKRILIANPNPDLIDIGITKNTYCLTSENIIAATFLPQGHAVRRILAAAMVERCLLCENHEFAQETKEYPTFGADLLQEVRETLKGLKIGQYAPTYKDPIDGSESKLTSFLAF